MLKFETTDPPKAQPIDEGNNKAARAPSARGDLLVRFSLEPVGALLAENKFKVT